MMLNYSINIQYGSSVLMAVPSAHFHHVFALKVNTICSDPSLRPDAIAVELGPIAVNEVAAWFADLNPKRSPEWKLPVMLGLLRENRLIRSSMMEKAMRFQEEHLMDLNELSPEVLQEQFEYSKYCLLCLSPTDSIIEALRCAFELKCPVYGVDLEESPAHRLEPIHVQDSLTAGNDLQGYITSTARLVERQRDEEIDGRREIVMAAQLKFLMSRHRRILFVCGLAHWRRIEEMLSDDSFRPVECITPMKEKAQYRRVVVHPSVAISHLDLFPRVAVKYEKWRRPCLMGRQTIARKDHLQPMSIFDRILKDTCKDYIENSKGVPLNGKWQDLMAVPDFLCFLMNLCLLDMREVPDMFMALDAATKMMSREFVQCLGNTFMRYPWVLPSEMPDYPVLLPDKEDGMQSGISIVYEKESNKQERVFVRPIYRGEDKENGIDFSFEWEDPKSHLSHDSIDFVTHTWPPWDCLVSSMSIRAINMATIMTDEVVAEPFSDSLLGGIDIRATIRSIAKGKETIYVRDRVKRFSHPKEDMTDGFPVVWILEPGSHHKAYWSSFVEYCSWMGKHMTRPAEFKYVVEKQGNKMVAITAYADSHVKTEASIKHPDISSYLFHGFILYDPICWTKKQFAYWAELTDFKRNPFCRDTILHEGIDSALKALFKKRYDISVEKEPWETLLIRMAIPFAGSFVTVVAPDGLQIDSKAYEMARDYGVEISRVSLGRFSREDIRRMSFNHMSPAKNRKPKAVFDRSIEVAIGERQTDNQHLVPEEWFKFGEMDF